MKEVKVGEEGVFRLRAREFDQRIGKLPRQELIDLKNRLESEMDGIRVQLEDAKTELITEGIYANRDWYVRARQALKIKGRQCQKIQQQLGALKEAKSKFPMPMAICFVDVAREILDPEVFEKIRAEARGRAHALVSRGEATE